MSPLESRPFVLNSNALMRSCGRTVGEKTLPHQQRYLERKVLRLKSYELCEVILVADWLSL